MRCNNEIDVSLGSLFDRSRPVEFADGGGAPSAPGATPETGSSVCMKQHRFPYGQAPETQKVYGAREHGHRRVKTINVSAYPTNFGLVLQKQVNDRNAWGM